MAAENSSWYVLPAEIRLLTLEALIQDGCKLAGFATVSREWQTIVERHNFARIKLTWSRLAGFGSILARNRALVRYLWLCLELEAYDCTQCAPEHPRSGVISKTDNILSPQQPRTCSRFSAHGNQTAACCLILASTLPVTPSTGSNI